MSRLTTGEVAAFGGEVKRKGVVSFIPDIRIGAALEQRPDDRFVAGAEVQRRTRPCVAWQRAALVDDVGRFVEDRGDRSGIALAGRREQPSALYQRLCHRRLRA